MAEFIPTMTKRSADEEDTKRNKNLDCIMHGGIKKLLGPSLSNWQTRYGKLYPNYLELHTEPNSDEPEMIFMDQIEEVVADFVMVKGEQCIVLKMKPVEDIDEEIILTSSDEIVLKEWLTSLQSTYKNSLELLATMEQKATNIFERLKSGVF